MPRPARLLLAFALTALIGRLDSESTSWVSVFQLQNVPAFLIYGGLIYLLLSVITGAFFRKRASR